MDPWSRNFITLVAPCDRINLVDALIQSCLVVWLFVQLSVLWETSNLSVGHAKQVRHVFRKLVQYSDFWDSVVTNQWSIHSTQPTVFIWLWCITILSDVFKVVQLQTRDPDRRWGLRRVTVIPSRDRYVWQRGKGPQGSLKIILISGFPKSKKVCNCIVWIWGVKSLKFIKTLFSKYIIL